MAEIKWTLQAADDLESIAEFISKDSPYYARLLISDMLSVVDRVGLFPSSGRCVPEADNLDLREIIVADYRIIYRSNPPVVEILTVYHAARLFDVDLLD